MSIQGSPSPEQCLCTIPAVRDIRPEPKSRRLQLHLRRGRRVPATQRESEEGRGLPRVRRRPGLVLRAHGAAGVHGRGGGAAAGGGGSGAGDALPAERGGRPPRGGLPRALFRGETHARRGARDRRKRAAPTRRALTALAVAAAARTASSPFTAAFSIPSTKRCACLARDPGTPRSCRIPYSLARAPRCRIF